MEILYETNDLIVAVKEPGVLSEESGNRKSMPKLLREYLAAGGAERPEIRTVHRLDRDVGGVMMFAKNAKTASLLSAAVAERRVVKEYFAVATGRPEKEEDVWEDLLFRDASAGKTYVVDRMRKGVRDARLSYRVIASADAGGRELTLVRVKLDTGRTHQIRVQFASRGYPLWGDGRYGGKDGGKAPALFSFRLEVPGVFSCAAAPREGVFRLFQDEIAREIAARTEI